MMFGIDVVTLAYGAAGSLIASAIIWSIGYIVGVKYGERKTKKKYQAQYEAAIKQFINSIWNIILLAMKELNSKKYNDEDVLSSARAIVSTRDSMRDQLENAAMLLNSDIDNLKKAIRKCDESKKSGSDCQIWHSEIKSILNTIHKKWPEKGPQIDLAYRKILAEIGLSELVDNN